MDLEVQELKVSNAENKDMNKDMNKLIRDEIPGMPEDAWEKVCPVEAYEYLKKKLDEEILELKESEYKDIYEYADVIEVLRALARYNKKRWSSIEVARKIKFKERGGFSNKILKSTEIKG